MLHHAEVVAVAPMFYGRSVGEPEDVDLRHGKPIIRWCDAHELILVCAGRRQAARDQVSIGHQQVHVQIQVRKGVSVGGHDLIRSFSLMPDDRVAVAPLWVYERSSLLDFPLAEYLFNNSTKSGLVIFRHNTPSDPVDRLALTQKLRSRPVLLLCLYTGVEVSFEIHEDARGW